MLFSIFFFSACSDKEEIDNSFKITVTPPTLMLKVGETAFITVNDGNPQTKKLPKLIMAR